MANEPKVLSEDAVNRIAERCYIHGTFPIGAVLDLVYSLRQARVERDAERINNEGLLRSLEIVTAERNWLQAFTDSLRRGERERERSYNDLVTEVRTLREAAGRLCEYIKKTYPGSQEKGHWKEYKERRSILGAKGGADGE